MREIPSSNVGSRNGLLSVRRHALPRINAEWLSVRPLGIICSTIRRNMHFFHQNIFAKAICKIVAILFRPQWLWQCDQLHSLIQTQHTQWYAMIATKTTKFWPNIEMPMPNNQTDDGYWKEWPAILYSWIYIASFRFLTALLLTVLDHNQASWWLQGFILM